VNYLSNAFKKGKLLIASSLLFIVLGLGKVSKANTLTANTDSRTIDYQTMTTNFIHEQTNDFKCNEKLTRKAEVTIVSSASDKSITKNTEIASRQKTIAKRGRKQFHYIIF
jgi:hypothetical protein